MKAQRKWRKVLCNVKKFSSRNAENVLNELGDLAKEIFRQSGEDANWILLASYSKMREERNKLKE